MSGTTVRIRPETHQTLRELAAESGEPLREILAKAVEAYRRQRILDATNAAYTAMRAGPAAWAEELASGRLWAYRTSSKWGD